MPIQNIKAGALLSPIFKSNITQPFRIRRPLNFNENKPRDCEQPYSFSCEEDVIGPLRPEIYTSASPSPDVLGMCSFG
jgi:hypothetical protein